MGVREIDMVLSVGHLKERDYAYVAEDIARVVAAAHSGRAITKVILETALLSEEEIVDACILAVLAGAEFVKTSTGFGPGGARQEQVALMRAVVGTHAQV
jgi:deoxyribose-phosphate aldolase